MDKYGLLGEKLGHSYSPQIHAMLYPNEYRLCEVRPDGLADFLKNTELQGMNVTIPYKKDVIPLCAELSDTAARIGSVNTLVRGPEGWRGYNTDYDGFTYMIRHSGIDVRGKKAVILGNGGVSLTVRTVLSDLGAGEIRVISRRGEDNYDNLSRHADAQLVVNATPVGMYPNNGSAAVDLAAFPQCEAVYDLIYNPAKTALLLQAEKLGLIWENGLGMLVAQAKRSAELFTGQRIDDGRVEEITRVLERQMGNILLIGMPGCGKSTIGETLARELVRPFVDADDELVKAAGMSIPEIFAREGETGFRARETQTLSQLCKRSGCVIATGGGCVTRPENLPLLRQNGSVVWIKRSLDVLPTEGRPLSQANSAQKLFEERREKYAAFADVEIENDGAVDDAVRKIREALE